MKKILMATGGTGGHIFPALSLAFELLEKRKDLQITFAGHGLEGNPYFHHQQFVAHSIVSDPLNSKNPLTLLEGVGRLGYGFLKSRSLLKKTKPDLVIGFGSYHTFPILSSAVLGRYPLILHEANAVPGKINRLFSPYSEFVGVHFNAAKEGLKGRTEEAPLPLRPGYKEAGLTKEESRRHLGLLPTRPTLLVFGGSQGAKSLNRFFLESIPLLQKKMAPFQVIHFVGKDIDEKKKAETVYRSLAIPCFVASFVSDMRYPLRAADLAFVRSGASTLAELSAFACPAIFLPFPHAADQHQEKNGRFVADHIGGGKVIRENEMTASLLAEEIALLFSSGQLVKMAEDLRNFEKRRETLSFSSQILQVLER